MLQCPGEDCEETGRYFKAADRVGKGCTCRADCYHDCQDIVTGSEWRKSAWRRRELVCKCPEGSMVAGDNEACNSNADNGRYFSKKTMRDQHCHCQPQAGGEAPPP